MGSGTSARSSEQARMPVLLWRDVYIILLRVQFHGPRQVLQPTIQAQAVLGSQHVAEVSGAIGEMIFDVVQHVEELPPAHRVSLRRTALFENDSQILESRQAVIAQLIDSVIRRREKSQRLVRMTFERQTLPLLDLFLGPGEIQEKRQWWPMNRANDSRTSRL